MTSKRLLDDAILILLRDWKERLEHFSELQENIKPLMKLKNISQEEFAAKINMPLSTLKARLKDPSTWTKSEIHKAYEYFTPSKEE